MAEKKKENLGCHSVARLSHATARDTFYRPKKRNTNRQHSEDKRACPLKTALSNNTRITVDGELTFEFMPASANSTMQILSPETAFSLHCMAQSKITCNAHSNTNNVPDSSVFTLRRDVIDSYMPRIF